MVFASSVAVPLSKAVPFAAPITTPSPTYTLSAFSFSARRPTSSCFAEFAVETPIAFHCTTVIGLSAARTFAIMAFTDAGSPRSAGSAAALMPFAASAFAPATSLSSLRATMATEKPSARSFSATAWEIPALTRWR